MMVGMLIEKGYVLGESVVERAKALDEKHQIAATVKEKAVELNEKCAGHNILCTSCLHFIYDFVLRAWCFSEI